MVILWLILRKSLTVFPKWLHCFALYRAYSQGSSFSTSLLTSVIFFPPSLLSSSCLPFLPSFSLLQEREEEVEAACFNLCPLLPLLCPLSWVLCLPLIGSPHFQRRASCRADWDRNLTVSGFMVPVGKSSNSPPLSPQSLSVHVDAHTCVKYKWTMKGKSIGSVTGWVTSVSLSNIECSSLQCAPKNEK